MMTDLRRNIARNDAHRLVRSRRHAAKGAETSGVERSGDRQAEAHCSIVLGHDGQQAEEVGLRLVSHRLVGPPIGCLLFRRRIDRKRDGNNLQEEMLDERRAQSEGVLDELGLVREQGAYVHLV